MATLLYPALRSALSGRGLVPNARTIGSRQLACIKRDAPGKRECLVRRQMNALADHRLLAFEQAAEYLKVSASTLCLSGGP
jgi:hypothetical protein